MVKKFVFICGCMLLSTTVNAYATIDNHVIKKHVKIEKHNVDKIDVFKNNMKCLTDTAIRESENQNDKARISVLYTIKNRAELSGKSYCSVVNAKNQFSHRKMKISDDTRKEFTALAFKVMLGTIDDPTNGSTYFHDDSLKKNPFKNTKFSVKYDNMVFYRPKSLSRIYV
jgi:spore germination cell wall hydrolase CwlJ-like protein